MGIYATAHLVFGIPVEAYDPDTAEDTQWWDDDGWIDPAEALVTAETGETNPYCDNLPNGDRYAVWRGLKQAANPGFRLVTWGHYRDPDGPRAIASPTGVPEYTSDCWDAGLINPKLLVVPAEKVQAANDTLQRLGFSGNFDEAQWMLVASYG